MVERLYVAIEYFYVVIELAREGRISIAIGDFYRDRPGHDRKLCRTPQS